jgi:cytidyltransferase-like protein
MKQVVVTGSFDDLWSQDIRFLQEASRLGEVTVLLWSDMTERAISGRAPKFPEEERLYLLRALRYVHDVIVVCGDVGDHGLPHVAELAPQVWAVRETDDSPAKKHYCVLQGISYHVVRNETMQSIPPPAPLCVAPGRKSVVVTGCFDWFHSGHVRFFEEAAELGDLYVTVGNDANLRELKGEGHPLFPQEERRYMVQSVRHVKHAMVATGHGWLDAEPEMERIKPDYYVVNEDGDKPIKREYCEKHGIEYRVLRRVPKSGLPRRTSTNLRGF